MSPDWWCHTVKQSVSTCLHSYIFQTFVTYVNTQVCVIMCVNSDEAKGLFTVRSGTVCTAVQCIKAGKRWSEYCFLWTQFCEEYCSSRDCTQTWLQEVRATFTVTFILISSIIWSKCLTYVTGIHGFWIQECLQILQLWFQSFTEKWHANNSNICLMQN